MTLQKDRPNLPKDTPEKPVVFGKAPLQLKTGEWYAVTAVLCGADFAVTLHDHAAGRGRRRTRRTTLGGKRRDLRALAQDLHRLEKSSSHMTYPMQGGTGVPPVAAGTQARGLCHFGGLTGVSCGIFQALEKVAVKLSNAWKTALAKAVILLRGTGVPPVSGVSRARGPCHSEASQPQGPEIAFALLPAPLLARATKTFCVTTGNSPEIILAMRHNRRQR